MLVASDNESIPCKLSNSSKSSLKEKAVFPYKKGIKALFIILRSQNKSGYNIHVFLNSQKAYLLNPLPSSIKFVCNFEKYSSQYKNESN
jgi:hypothetical protein